MRTTALLSFTLLRATLATSDGYSPFVDPLFGLSNEALLVKRQNSCQSGYNACSNLNADGACCPSDTNCALDNAGHVACCPFNAVCTGTVSGTIVGTATGSSSTASTSPVLLGATTSTTTFQTANTQPAGGVLQGSATVNNAFYPFVFISRSFPDAAACSSAFTTTCQLQSTSCLSSLAGVNGVTVGGFGGGITVQGSSGTVLSSASSICSSLSLSACYGLANANGCSVFSGATGTNAATATTTNGGTFVQAGSAGPRQTACPGMLYAAGAGVVVGAVGALV